MSKPEENYIVFFFAGVILFGIHSDDLSDEISNLLAELSSSKMALWKQMCVVEIVAAQIAEDLGKDGTRFEMDPDRVIWPDGTVTKKPTGSQAKKGSKKVSPASKHGVYGVIVAQYGNGKKVGETSKEATATAPAVVVEQANAEPTAQPKSKTVRWGNSFFIFPMQILSPF